MNRHVLAWLDDHREELLCDCIALCAIPSVDSKSQAVPGAPFGPNVLAALEMILARAKALGLKTRNMQGYLGDAQTPGPAGEPLAVLGHVDVVPAEGVWTAPPFVPSIRQGRLYARGTIDDKGPTLAALYATAALVACGVPLKRPIRLIFGCDEETGCQDMAYYRALNGMPEEGFSPDACFPVIHAEKGILWAKITCTGSFNGPLLRFWAGETPNTVPAAAHALLRIPLSPAQCRLADERGIELQPDGMSLIAKGRTAHGSTPENGDNAAIRLARFLQEILHLPPASAAARMLAWITAATPDGSGCGLACGDESIGRLTCNVGTVDYDAAALPARAALIVDIRYPVNLAPGAMADKLRAVHARMCGPGRKQDVAVLTDKPPLYHPPDDPLVQTLCRVYNRHAPKLAALHGLPPPAGPLGPVLIGGGTYAREMNRGVAFGPQVPGGPDRAHTADEYIGLEELNVLAQVYAEALLALCG